MFKAAAPLSLQIEGGVKSYNVSLTCIIYHENDS